MASTSQVYRLRPGRFADIAAAARLGDICFRDDHLFAILFPNRLEHLEEFKVHIRRLYETRYWTLGYVLTLAVDEDDRVVGCSWWRRPDDEFSVFYTWLSPCKSFNTHSAILHFAQLKLSLLVCGLHEDALIAEGHSFPSPQH